MKVSVWDTYVQRTDGKLMHFDILAPTEVTSNATIVDFGKQYLQTKSFGIQELTTQECRLCHIENATEEIISSINKSGFSIIEIENCH